MRNKDKITSLKKGYTKIPSKIFRMNLNSNALSLYCFFTSLSEKFNPGLSFLTKTLNLSKNTVIKYIKELENRNIIRKYRKGSPGKFSLYEFMSPDMWISNDDNSEIEEEIDNG